jgi:hypothetical protein
MIKRRREGAGELSTCFRGFYLDLHRRRDSANRFTPTIDFLRFFIAYYALGASLKSSLV